MGGWSQARYQRHIENFHLQHAKEVAETLARIVRDERIDSIVIAGDEVIVPLLKEQFSKEVAERVIDVVKLDIRAPEREMLEKTIAALREKDSETDREKVEALIGAYRANGLGVVGYDDTKAALELGQVEELVITATPDAIDAGEKHAGDVQPDRTVEERAADELVAKARQTAATDSIHRGRVAARGGRRRRRVPEVQGVRDVDIAGLPRASDFRSTWHANSEICGFER